MLSFNLTDKTPKQETLSELLIRAAELYKQSLRPDYKPAPPLDYSDLSAPSSEATTTKKSKKGR